MNIEPLEARIAPASFFKFTDVDGDNVVITSSVGDLNAAGVVTLLPVTMDFAQLQVLDFRSAAFQDAKISIVATRDPVNGGDGLVNVGYINATGRDLGTVLVDGDLGVIDAGDPTNPASASKGLSVLSLGRHGASTGAPADLTSDFDGKLDKLTVKTDVQGATINVTDSAGTNGAIGSIFLGGSLIGGATDDSGRIVTSADIGAVTIKGDIAGGDGMNSGVLKSGGKIASVTLGGSLLGGTDVNAGQIISTLDMGPLKITGNVRGGTATGAGLIQSLQNMASVFLGGSLVGGSANNTGEIVSLMTTGKVFIGGDVLGGVGTDSGKIKSVGNMGTVTINGSVIGGAGDHTGSGHNGQIVSLGDMGAVKVGHDIRGGGGAHSAEIRAAGKLAGVTVLGSLLGGPAGVLGEFAGRLESGGDLGPVKIGHDVAGGNGEGSGSIKAGSKIASVTIGGSLLGGTNLDSGQIRSGGDMGAVKIVGDIKGSTGQSSGLIRSQKLASITVGGSIIGGSGLGSGKVLPFGDTGAVKIGHDVIGGSAQEAGGIFIQASVLSVTIGGSLIGGSAPSTGVVRATDDLGAVKIGRDLVGSASGGAIFSSFGKVGAVTIGGSVLGGSLGSRLDMGPVKIAGDLTGASISGSASSMGAGSILVGDLSIPDPARLTSLFIGGSILAGVDKSSGSLTDNATIRVKNDIGSLTVKGSIVGSAHADNDPSDGDFTPVLITAKGQAVQGAKTDLAIGKISVGGRVEFARILAGYDVASALNAANPDAQIGAVSVGGNWIASSLVAGAQNNSLPANTNFGNLQDLKIITGTDNAAITSKIASITIGGQVMGTVGGTDHFGFVAEQVVAFKVGGTTIPLSADPAVDDNVALGITGDVNIHEV